MSVWVCMKSVCDNSEYVCDECVMCCYVRYSAGVL